jgi:hypothetical protein
MAKARVQAEQAIIGMRSRMQPGYPVEARDQGVVFPEDIQAMIDAGEILLATPEMDIKEPTMTLEELRAQLADRWIDMERLIREDRDRR